MRILFFFYLDWSCKVDTGQTRMISNFINFKLINSQAVKSTRYMP